MISDARTLRLLDGALALDEAARTVYLDRECAGEPALRAEVDALLAADAAADGFLEPVAAPRAEASGELVGPYRLLRELGSGGMGRVWLAERADALYDKRVAVKFLRYDFGDMRTRFANERRILATLDHPNIAKLLDAGADARGAPFVVMEYVEGEPITRYASTHWLDARARVALFLQVLDAVQAAHGHLVVHRDLKPGNILVDAAGAPKLLDFGIAKLLDVDVQALTKTGVGPMTPDYASPEQVRGEPIGTASDVYALGVLLYELLAGRRPYEIAALTPSAIERVVCDTEPERPSALARRAGTLRVDTDLDHVVLKAMAKSPGDRYASCAQFADDLRRWLDGQPVHAVHAGWRYRALKFVRRHRLGVAATVLVAAALLGSVAVAIGQASTAREQARAAQLERDRAERVTGFLTAMLGAANPAEGGRKVTVAELLDSAARDVDGELGADPQTAAEVQGTLAQTYRALGLLEPALAQARAAYARVSEPAARADAALVLGQILLERGDYDDARPLIEDARTYFATRPDHAVDRANADVLLGQWESQQQRFAEAERHFADALATLQETVGASDRRLGELYDNMAVTKGRAGDLAAAERLHERALAIFRRARGVQHPEAAHVLFNLGNVREMRDDFAGAERAFAEAAAIQRETLGAHHPDLAQTLASHTFMLNRAGRYAEAAARGRDAVDAAYALPSPHPIRAYASAMHGEALLNAGDAAAAVAPLRDAAEQRAAMLPDDHPLRLNSASLLGAALAAGGRREEGVRTMRDAHARLAATLGADHEFTKRAQARLERYGG